MLRSHAPAILKGWGGDIEADSIVFVRDGSPMLYTGSTQDDDELLNYLLTNKESNVRSLNDASFEVGLFVYFLLHQNIDVFNVGLHKCKIKAEL